MKFLLASVALAVLSIGSANATVYTGNVSVSRAADVVSAQGILYTRNGSNSQGLGTPMQLRIASNSFVGFCMEAGATAMAAGNTGNFAASVVGMDTVRNTMLNNLFSAYYGSINFADNTQAGVDRTAGFQAAVWEILYDAPTYSVAIGAGNFYVRGTDAVSNEIRSNATTYLAGAMNYTGAKLYDVTALASGSYQDLIFATPAAPVPEPASIAMMLAGLGVVGFVARRRRAA